jgi:hypothetical protein
MDNHKPILVVNCAFMKDGKILLTRCNGFKIRCLSVVRIEAEKTLSQACTQEA